MSELLAAAKRTLVESIDSKKATASFAGFLAVVLVSIAGKAGWTWLDQETANALATKLSVIVVGYVMAQAHVDHAEAKAGTPSVEPSKN